MADATLGKLERIDLRTIWSSESSDFTPWLALSENLAVLSETLGVELELEAREKSVGRFSADLICKEVGADRRVLIENQLEKTDHSHLGQILTYCAGLHAVTIVWIAATFTEEHRAALDWLNEITDETVRFFGLEVELWRIGTSPAAPKFNIISKPNDWSRFVAQAARSLEGVEPTDTRLMQQKYWAALNIVLDNRRGPVKGDRKPQLASWMSYPIGRASFSLNAAMNIRKGSVRSELYITGPNAKAFFWLLNEQKPPIETEIGYPLKWEDLPEGRDTRISVTLENVDIETVDDWSKQHDWLAKSLNDMHRVFSHRVHELKPEKWQPAESDAGEAH